MAGTYPAYLEAYDEAPRSRRGRRLFIGLFVLLLVLAGLLVVADRVAAGYAERTVSDRIQKQLAAQSARSSRPEVSIAGFPFLTQVMAGRYESISIRLRDVRSAVEGNTIKLPILDVRVRDLHAPLDALRSGEGDVVAATVDGNATLTYGSIATLMDRPGLRLKEQDGKLVVNGPLKVLGQEVVLHGTAKVSAEDNQVRLRFDELTAEGLPQLPQTQSVLENYAKKISINIPLPDLPFKMDVKQVQVLPEGLVVTAEAKNVSLRSMA